MLRSLGLDALVADGPDAYAALAARLANDGPARAALRSRLSAAMQTAPFLDSDGFASKVGDTLNQIFRDNSEKRG